MTLKETLAQIAVTEAKKALPKDGTIIYTGCNWARKWYRDEWEVQDGMAHPKKRHHFWASVRGDVEDRTGQEPCRIENKEVVGYGRFATRIV